jgi:hypothetical protein
MDKIQNSKKPRISRNISALALSDMQSAKAKKKIGHTTLE